MCLHGQVPLRLDNCGQTFGIDHELTTIVHRSALYCYINILLFLCLLFPLSPSPIVNVDIFFKRRNEERSVASSHFEAKKIYHICVRCTAIGKYQNFPKIPSPQAVRRLRTRTRWCEIITRERMRPPSVSL